MPLSRRQQARLIKGRRYLRQFRHRLAYVDAAPQLALLGILSGLLSALLILLFRALIEIPLETLLPGNSPENFEALEPLWRALLPIIGALSIGFGVYFFARPYAKVGVAHVLERLHLYQGKMPLGNALNQLIAGAVAALSGLSVGREGPAIHLGAAISSHLGNWLYLPHNSLRILIACGSAAAISASFNTPIAGVIFAMEVIMMEYAISQLIPVILASVTGAIISQAVYGNSPAFDVPELRLNSLWELPYVLILGILIGAMASLFIRLVLWANRWSALPFWLRMTAVGLLTGFSALLIPAVMGIGYDSVNAALIGQLAITSLLVMGLAKLALTAISVGLGTPGGLIGPSLFIGACLGGTLGELLQLITNNNEISSGFYAMLGMGAMMGACLQAPLAALMALLELTDNTEVIFPGMLAIVSACLCASALFKSKSVFLSLLQNQGLSLHNEPISQGLRNVGVEVILDKSFIQASTQIHFNQLSDLLAHQPTWLLIRRNNEISECMRGAELARFVDAVDWSEAPESLCRRYPEWLSLNTEGALGLNLLEIPLPRQAIRALQQRATLYEAWQALEQQKLDMLYIRRSSMAGYTGILGVISRDAIENYYRYQK